MKKILSAVLACTATMALATTAFAENAGATDAGATDAAGSDVKIVEIEKKLTLKDGKLTVAGDTLTTLLTDEDGTKYAWADVEEIVFSSKETFCVAFAADKAKVGVDTFVMGVNELKETPASEGVEAPEAVRADDSAKWATKWDLTSDYIAVFAATPSIDLASESGKEIEIDATVTVKVDAAAEDPSNPATGIALAVAPAGLAVAFVAVAAVMSKKKRG